MENETLTFCLAKMFLPGSESSGGKTKMVAKSRFGELSTAEIQDKT